MPRVLPKEFEQGHDLAFVLHDILASYVVAGEKAGLQFSRHELRGEEDVKSLEGVKDGEEFWQWCEANGHRDWLDQFCYRALIFGLLSDFCQFVYEGLQCSAKGKLSVAFTDFRKPLQDNLFYLEWILADWPGFLARFRQGPEHIDPTKIEQDLNLRKAMRVDNIGKAMDKTPMGRWIDPEWLYELRYEKASNFGLDPVFNHALHVVTTSKHYATSPENMNFIFCNDDDREELWRRLYLLLPPVLIHSVYVLRTLFKTFAPDFEPHEPLTELWLLVGFLLWTESIDGEENRRAAESMLADLLKDAPLACPCGQQIAFDSDNTRSFWERGEVRCAKCQAVHPLFEPEVHPEESEKLAPGQATGGTP